MTKYARTTVDLFEAPATGPDKYLRPEHRLILSYRALEARLVFDAAMVATVNEAAQADTTAATADGTAPASDAPDLTALAGALDAARAAASDETTIVFIDENVTDLATLLAHIPAGAEIVMLQSEQDALGQIAAALDGRSNIDSIHIVSHGKAGELDFSSGSITANGLADRASELAIIGQALSADGDILVYGCDVAAGTIGQEFVDALALYTGADIAASTDDTGGVALGGNWALEQSTGSIEATALSADEYNDLLALVAANDTNSIAADATVPITRTAATGVLSNDTGTGTKTITEVHGRAASVGVAYASSYGTITMNADGSYSYTVDVNNATVKGLANGQTITDIISYTAKDGTTSAADFGYLTVTINGVTDAPVAYDNFGEVTPVIAPSTSGNLITDAGAGSTDTIDRPQSLFVWETLYANGASIVGTKTVDGVSVGVTTTNPSGISYTAVAQTTATQGGHTGYAALTIDPASLAYTAPTTAFSFSQPVVNLSFGLLDVDSGAPSWQDQVTITGTRGGVPVTFSAQFSGYDTRAGNSFFGNKGGVANSDALGNVVIVFDGAVDNVVIAYNDGPNTNPNGTNPPSGNPGGHLIGISDLTWQNPNSVSLITVKGTTVPAGGITIPATYGSITVRPDGSYTYNVDPLNAAVIALPQGATLVDDIPYTIRDALNQTASAVYHVTINGINEVPVLDLDANNSTGATGTASVKTYVENGAGVSIADVDASITDVDTGSTIASATVVLTNRQPGDVLTVGSLPPGVTAVIDTSNPAQITVTLTGPDSKANYASYLAGITFSNTTETPSNVDRNITVVVNDGIANSNTAISTIKVTPVNDAPSGIDQVRAINEDVAFTFAAADFGFTDPEGNTLKSVIISSLPSASEGVLRLGGVAVTAGQELTLLQIASLTFTPAANVNGNSIGLFTFQVRDTGGTANGGIDLDATANAFQFNVAPINDAPVTTVPAAQSVREDAPLVFSSANGNLIAITDLDAGATGVETVTLSVVNGTINLGSIAGLTGLSGNGTGSVAFTGTVAQINAAIAGLSYQGNANFNGADTLTISVADDGKDNSNATSNGVLSAAVQTVAITVQSVNDAPAGTDKTVSINEDTGFTFATADFGFSDIDGNALQSVVITTIPPASEGVLRVGGVAVLAGQEITVAQLATLTFTPAVNVNGTTLGSFTFQVRDNGGTANGGVNLDATPNTINFNIAPINDAPASNVPGAQAVLEDAALVFSSANSNAITISDVDAGSTGFETVTLSVTNGTLSLGSVAGLTGLSGNGTGTVVFTGTTAQVNAAVAGLSYQGNANFNGADTLTISVTDDGKDNGNTTSNGALPAAVRTVALTVTPVNDAPVSTVPPAQTVAEDMPLIFSGATAITIADADAGGTGLETVTLTVAHGTLTLGSTSGLTGLTGNGSGTVTFTGTLAQVNAAIAGLNYQGVPNYNGPDLLTIQVGDDGKDNGVAAANGALQAVIKTVAINVTPVNDPPVANTDTAATNEDAPVTILAAALLANDTDIDGDTLTITSVQAPVNGTVALDINGNPVFTPDANYSGPASFTYTISDGKGGTSTATVNLTIAAVNDAPAAADDAYATGEKTVLSVPVGSGLLFNDSDIDGGALSVVQINGNTITPGAPIALPSGAVLTPNANGTFSYNPNGAYNALAGGQTALDSFTYQVSDGNGGFATATAIVTITGINDAPVANPDTNSTDPQVPITITAANGLLRNDTDAEGDTLTVSAVGGSLANVGNAITGSNGGTFIINADGSYSFDPGTAFDTLPPGSSASTSITYTISDGNGGTSTTTLTISVPYQNLPPAVAQPVTAQSSLDGNTVSIPLTGVFSDPNPGDTLLITAAGLPPGLSYNSLTGAIEGTLSADASQHAGPYIVTLMADDGHGSSITTTFNFSVANRAPTAVNDVNSVQEHGTTSGAVLGNDADGGNDADILSVTQVNGAPFSPGATLVLPSGATLVMTASGTYDYNPNSAFNGLALGQSATDTFTYQISDGQGGTSTATVTITINGQNDAPILVDPADPGVTPNPATLIPAQSGTDGTAITPLNVTGYFTDPDVGDTLTLSVIGTLPAGVTFDPATGTFSGTPSANASQGGAANNGVYSVIVAANDGKGGIVTVPVKFTIGNPAPIANNDSNTVAEHATATGNVVTNDRDGAGDTDALTVTAVNASTLSPGATITLPSGALLVMGTSGAYTYNPNGAFASLNATQTATDSFTYQISDGQGGLATATATIIIQGQNDNPVALADTNTTNPQVAITVGAASGVLTNDQDVEGDLLSVTSISNGTTSVAAGGSIAGNNGGTFVINADGSYSFNPGNAFDNLAPGANASTSVTYTISDGKGGTSSTTLTITVPFTNLPPVVQAPVPTQNAMDGNAVSIPVTGVFADPNPGDVITITASGLPPGLSYNPLTGAIEGSLTANASQHSGPYIVTLLADDGKGGTITSTFNFNVGNPPPVAVNDSNTVTEHGTTSGDATPAGGGNDRDGGLDSDTLTVSQINGIAYTPGATITLASGALLVMNGDGTYTYDPNGSFNGLSVGQSATDSFTYQVSDGQGGTATATVSLTITGQNEVPIIVNPANPGSPPIDPNRVVPAQFGADGLAIAPLTVTSYFADADAADTLTLSVVPGELPPGVTFNAATGTFSGTPTANASQGGNAGPGVYDVVVTASDGNGGTVATTVRFTISNPAPVAANDSNSVAEHGTTSGTVLTNDTDGGGDNDALAVSQINGATFTPGSPVTLPSGAIVVMNANGSYSYDPNGSFPALQTGESLTDQFTYQVSDGQGGFTTATVTITVNGENDAPVANVDINSVLPQNSVAVVAALGLLSNDTDPESDALTVTTITNGVNSVLPGASIAGSNGGTFTINADGSYAFATGNDFDTLPPGTTATTSVTYSISDGQGGVSTSTLTISVPYSDLPPVVNQPIQPQSSMDGNTVLINVSNVFRDPNPGDVLTITAAGLPLGLVYNPASGAIEGTLGADASQHAGPYIVTLTARDPAGNMVTSTFQLTVGNPPPVAINDNNSVAEHGTTSGDVTPAAGNDRDGGSDSDPLSVTLINGATLTPGATITLPSGALLVMQTSGNYTYNPNSQFNGLALGQSASDNFTYQISDGQGGTSTATVSITITGENDQPVIVDPMNPGSPPADPLHVVPTQTALDGSPITPLKVTSVFADPDNGDVLTLSVPAASLPPGISFDPVTGTFSGTPTAAASQGGPANNGVYPIVVTATDLNGATVTTIVTFQVGNPAPVATLDNNSVQEHSTTLGNVIANDRDGGTDTDALTVSQVNGAVLTPGATITLPSGALLVMQANGDYTYNPNGVFVTLGAGETTTDQFTYQVSDGQGGFATATATIVINGENDAPFVVNPANPGTPPADPMNVIPAQTGVDGSVITPISVLSYFTDPDKNDTLTLSVPAASLPPGVNFDPVTGTFSGAPSANASIGGPANNGVYPVVITADDGHGGTVSTIITFTIGNVPPTAIADSNNVAEHGTITGNVVTNDADGGLDADVLIVTQINGTALTPGATITLPSGALLVMQADGSYTYDPNGVYLTLGVGETATDSFTYQVSDGQGGFATAAATITINGENDTPVIVDPANPGTPPADPNAIIPAQTASDGAPITPVSVLSYFRDPDTNDTLTLSVPAASLPPGVTFDPATGTFAGTPAADASIGGPANNGVYPIVITASDGNGGIVTTTITFTIGNVAPVAVNDTNSVTEHGTVSGDMTPGGANDHDGGGDTDVLTVTLINGATFTPGVAIPLPSGALLTVNADGSYSYDPNGTFNGMALNQSAPDSFTYRISDGQGGFSTATVNITITGENDLPFIVDPADPATPPADPSNIIPAQNATDGSPITGLNVTAYFADPDTGDTLTLMVNPATLPPGITFDPLTNTFSGTPTAAASQGGPGGNGIYPIVITADDGNGGTVTTIVTFVIANAPPIAGNDSISVGEHDTISGTVLSNDMDGGLDNDALTVTEVDGNAAAIGSQFMLPSGAMLTLNSDGTYAYDPNGAFGNLSAGQSASDTFSYTISDGNGGTSIANVYITIDGANEPPVVIDPANPGTPPADPMNIVPQQIAADGALITPLDVSVYFADADSTDVLTYAVNTVTLPAGISFDVATGIFSGTPSSTASQGGPAGNGVYPIVVTVSDGNGGTVSTVVTFNIGNPAPVAQDDPVSVAEHGTVSGSVLTNDADGGSDSDPLTVTKIGGSAASVGMQITLPSGALLTLNADGTYNYDPNGVFIAVAVGQEGTDSFTYTISDGQGGTSTATVTVTITGENDVPVVVNPANPGTPPADPNHVIPTQTGSDGTSITPIDVSGYFTDPDTGDVLTVSIDPAALPPGITFDPLTNTFSGAPTSAASQGGPNGDGIYEVVITAGDGNGGTVTTIITFDIGNVPPVAVNDTNIVLEDGSVTDTVLGNDHDGGLDADTLTVTAVNGVAGAVGTQITLSSGALLTLNANGSYTYDPNGTFNSLSAGQTGTDTFTYQVSDGQGGFGTASVTISVTGENDVPVVVDPKNPGVPPADPNHVIPTVAGPDGSPIKPINVTSYFRDPDALDQLTLSVTPGTLPPGIKFNPATGTFSGTMSPNASQGGANGDGVYHVVITASDGHGGTVSTIITFVATNPPPIATNDTGHTSPDTPVTLNVLGNDRDGGMDGDSLTVVSAHATRGDVIINRDGTLTFEPAPGFAGLVRITYTISDGQGGFATAYVTVLVTPNIHTLGTTDVDTPSPEQVVPSNLGMSSEGIVIATVASAGGLGSVSNSLGERGIVDAVANQISGLGGSAGAANSSRSQIMDVDHVWSLSSELDSYSGREQGTWNPEGLTGFSLRFTFAEDAETHDTAQVVLESLVRERTLIVRMSSSALPEHAHVVEYRVMQADGRALPGWLDRAGPELLIGERPADAEEIQLRVIAVLSDGTTIEHNVEIQTMSGEIQPLNVGKRADIAPMFSKQIAAELPNRQPGIEKLAHAMNTRW